jgi:hypothetical protein
MQTLCLPNWKEHNMNGLWIPIIAILATFAVPIVAIVMDYKRRKLQADERRAMIERGMEPPPLQERGMDFSLRRTPDQRRERALSGGIVMLALGIGLGLAAYLLRNVLVDTFISPKVAGPMTLGACVVGFIGLGNLVYYAVSRRRGGEKPTP